MAYRSRTVSKQKKDKVRLPDYMTRTVVIWGLKDEEKQAAFVQDLISIHARITKITIIKRKPAIKVQFRTTDDAIKIRSNRKLLKQWPHLYMKYGRDQNKDMKRPDNEQPDEEVDMLTNLAGSFQLGGGAGAESVASSQVELEELDEMSCTGASEKAHLMRKLIEHQEMQKLIQEEMDTQSVATTVPPLPSQMTFNVPESDQIKLVDVLNEELIDNELMNEETTSIKCRFALLSPAAWVNWIKGQIGLDKSKIDVHVNKDDSKIYIRFFTLAESRMIDDAFDGVLYVKTPENIEKCLGEKSLTEINCNVPMSPTELKSSEETAKVRQGLRDALRQSFAKFSNTSPAT